MTDYSNLFARRSSSSTRSTYYSSLDADTRADIDEFTEHLMLRMTEGSARSYRSNLCKALARPELELNSDQNSAINAFEKFLNER